MFFPTNTSIRLALTFELIENNYFLFNYWCSFICTDTAIIDLCLYYKIRIVQTHLVLFCFVDLQRHWKYNTLCIFIVSIAESVDHLLSLLHYTVLFFITFSTMELLMHLFIPSNQNRMSKDSYFTLPIQYMYWQLFSRLVF